MSKEGLRRRTRHPRAKAPLFVRTSCHLRISASPFWQRRPRPSAFPCTSLFSAAICLQFFSCSSCRLNFVYIFISVPFDLTAALPTAAAPTHPTAFGSSVASSHLRIFASLPFPPPSHRAPPLCPCARVPVCLVARCRCVWRSILAGRPGRLETRP